MIQQEENGKTFLKGFIGQRFDDVGLTKELAPVEEAAISLPDENLLETRNARWPRRWEKYVLGQPSMEITSEERRDNYV